MKKNLFLTLLAVVLAIIAIGIFFGNKTISIANFDECVSAGYPVMESYPRRCMVPEGDSWTEDIGNTLEKTDLIRLTSPLPGEKVKSPIKLSGEARGYWFFEASAPVEIVDANGNSLGAHYITAQGEWMTEDFVPFEGELEFNNPGQGTGKLILRKDNPSDLPENDDDLTIPIKFTNDL